MEKVGMDYSWGKVSCHDGHGQSSWTMPCYEKYPWTGQKRSRKFNFQTFTGFSQKHSNKQTDKGTSPGNMYWEKRGVISPLKNCALKRMEERSVDGVTVTLIPTLVRPGVIHHTLLCRVLTCKDER